MARHRHSWTALLVALTTALLPAQTAAPADVRTADPDPAQAFFTALPVLRIAITLDEAARDALRQRPREYASATLRIDGDPAFTPVGVKLKGAAGSFRNLDDRPGFTVHLQRFGQDHTLHGLRRFHLNNGAQDASRLAEWLGHLLFTRAGRPAPRVTHARVSLDGKDLGLYVLREAFDAQFLRRIGAEHGNLYDGGFCQDIDRDLEKDAGDGADDHQDLRRLREICALPPAERTAALAAILDVDAFLDFCALEAMLGHWDGYSQNRNNFRLWCATAPGQTMFFPHGMDQLFGDADASILRHPPALLASALLQDQGLRKRYRDRLRALLPLFQPPKVLPGLQQQAARLRRALDDDPDAARALEDAVRDLQGRVQARYRSLQAQVRAPEPQPLQFPGSRALALKGWQPAAETDHLQLDRKDFQGVGTLLFRCLEGSADPRVGSWRMSVLLGKGRYRLLATARCEGVGGEGARLVVDDAHSESLTGDMSWQALVCDFEVGEFQRDVELRLELRATAGRAWFRLDSLRLQRLPD